MSATEITAHDIETAIKIGLAQLGLMRAEVKIEVVDEGSKGVLGIGARHARVRLTPYVEPAAPAIVEVPAMDEDVEEIVETPEPVTAEEPQYDEADDVIDAEADEDEEEAAPVVGEEAVTLAATLTQGVLDRMDFECTCASQLLPAPDAEERATIWVDVQGEDANRLLTHQCEALDALQMVVQTMWAHQTKHNMRVTVDADNYKAQREKRLRQMALRIAERVVSGKRSITLEPMSASERRLVHIALRDHPDVMTESHGEGSARRITVRLK